MTEVVTVFVTTISSILSPAVLMLISILILSVSLHFFSKTLFGPKISLKNYGKYSRTAERLGRSYKLFVWFSLSAFTFFILIDSVKHVLLGDM